MLARRPHHTRDQRLHFGGVLRAVGHQSGGFAYLAGCRLDNRWAGQQRGLRPMAPRRLNRVPRPSSIVGVLRAFRNQPIPLWVAQHAGTAVGRRPAEGEIGCSGHKAVKHHLITENIADPMPLPLTVAVRTMFPHLPQFWICHGFPHPCIRRRRLSRVPPPLRTQRSNIPTAAPNISSTKPVLAHGAPRRCSR